MHRNENQVKLIIHPGLGKSATTLLQNRVFALLGYHNLGKESLEDVSRKALRQELFPSVSTKRQFKKRFRNPKPEIERLAQYLRSEIASVVSEQGTNTFVLSDETMLTYGSPDINFYRLTALASRLRELLKSEDSLSLEVGFSITIRNQLTYLPAHYSYMFSRIGREFRNFDTFIKGVKSDPFKGAPGNLFFDSLFDAFSSFVPEGMSVRFVPYEIIFEQGSLAFGEKVLGIPRTGSTENGDGWMINANPGHKLRIERGSAKIHYHFSNGMRVLGERGFPLAPSLHRIFETKLIRGAFKANDSHRLSRKSAELTSDQVREISQIYGESNSRLGAILGLDLSKFGYPVADI